MQENEYNQEDQEMTQEEQNLEQEEQTNSQLDSCRVQLKELQNKYFYLLADFDNYKKRMITDRTAYGQTSQMELIRKLLPVIDGMELAFAAQPGQSEGRDIQSWIDGLRMVYQSFGQFLRDSGIEEIPASGQFNPELHEALSQTASTEHTSGQITQVLQKGYTFKGTMIRPALVTVAQ